MNKKTTAALTRVILISLVMLLNIAAISSAANRTWDNEANDGNWTVALNWSSDTLPNSTSDYAKINMATGPVFSTGRTATAYRVYLDGTNGTITMDGGTLATNNWICIGYTAASDSGTLTVNSGTITTNGTSGHLFCGDKGTATLNMSGGTINIAAATFYVAHDPGSSGTVNLSGGTINCNDLSMRANDDAANGTINITGIGTLVINGDMTAKVNDYVSNGWIKAYNGAGTVLFDYNVTTPGRTTVRTTTKAVYPSPANNAVDVAIDANLGWTAGPGAVSHNVYFGTSNPPAFAGNQTSTIFDLGVLDLNTVYYWRIDEVNGPNIVTGDVWSFTTTLGMAKNPNPSNGATNISLNKVLSWTAGYGADSHDVYLGTSLSGVTNAERPEGDLDKNGQVDYIDILILANYWLQDPAGSVPYAGVNDDDIVDFYDYTLLAENWKGQASPYFKGNKTDPNYDDPCSFGLSTTYYWRVDEICGSEIRKGDMWSFTTAAVNSDYSLVGKIMCGYQGWFNCPGDGTTRGWVHWGSGDFSPTNCTVDMWPDMNEMSEGEKFLASAFDEGSNHFYVFSSHNYNTVLRHFSWMEQYGIDGVYLQRFATEVTPGSAAFNHRNDVLSYCKEGANLYGRKYAVMYDLSGLNAGGTQKVIDDWKFLVDTMHVGRDANDLGYMFHNGKPVVAVWGLGFGRAYEGEESYNLINFLKNDPCYGGCTVMIGVDNDWETSVELRTLLLADIISPWTVGRYGYGGSTSWITTNAVPEKTWCNNNGKEYLPVIWPGFSWYNLNDGPSNQHPRYGGQFLWDQLYANISIIDANMIYVAMFDEVDEGTAIFKVSNNPPTSAPFVTYRQDLPPPAGGPGILPAGAELPSDEYLWLVGQACRGLRGEITVTPTRPAR